MSFAPISAGPFALTQVANATNPPGTAVYTGTITGGAGNAFAGYYFTITGFTLSNGSNNGTYYCLASGGTSLTLVNSNAVSETGTATASGAQVLLETGPFAPAATFENPNLGGEPPVTGLLIPQDSPKGSSLVPRNYVNGWNYVNSELSTENYVSALVNAAHDGISFNSTEPPPALNVAQTTPIAPTGSYVQQGTPAINAANPFSSGSGLNPSQVAVFRFQ